MTPPTASVPARRDYAGLLSCAVPPSGATREERTRLAADALWEAFSTRGVSWVGFYHAGPGPDEMTLGAARNKPACSPIGLFGVCGRGLVGRRPVVVRDVASLGADYIACDPRDRSEVVVPCFEPGGVCWGVLDVDSYDVGAFDAIDAERLGAYLVRLGLSAPGYGAALEIV